MPMIPHQHDHEQNEGAQAAMIEDVKLSTVTQLLGLLSLGYQWTSETERMLWVAALAYIEQRGSAKVMAGADIHHPIGEA